MAQDLAVAFIYDDHTHTLEMSNVSRRAIQSTLDRAMFVDIPEAPEFHWMTSRPASSGSWHFDVLPKRIRTWPHD